MAPLPGVPADIALVQGPLLLGYLFGYGLFGVLVVQMYFYHLNFPKDDRWIKIFVWIVFSAEILSSVFSTIAAWQGLAAGWGDLDSLAAPTWSFTTLPPICGFISSCVQIFFCWRISVLGKSRILPLFIAVISILSWAMAFYCGIKARTPVLKINELDPEVWLTGSAVCDVMIAVVMVRFLIRASSSSHWMETKDMLNKLIKLTVETGMITAFGATIELIFFWVFHHNNIHFILYSNTILATLNARAVFKSGSSVSSGSAQGRSVALWEDSGTSFNFTTGRSGTATAPSVKVMTTRRMTDENGNDMQMVVLPQSETSQIDDETIRDSKKQVDSVD
ncbi:hypothetical protein HETIRDRAFT_456021 [Heterobasidion irregulare TC 32-1]|uniref:DUF6534 domain-containing protein n=1 Tax=Heterobasidion irregulare (strain TC 32-1) TaxID=747525 RepID=W4JPF0_HETIT|nr:uncharacterized protein HETIRDRAFT_456021 [Heterobasidion irregulare TC 32-1]ETW75408.1 hypothetical protein HETIRDRAFT_456021 [Heterobasidion irregulare TC 32-1]